MGFLHMLWRRVFIRIGASFYVHQYIIIRRDPLRDSLYQERMVLLEFQ